MKWKDGLITFEDAPGESLYLSTPSVTLEKGDIVVRWSTAPKGAKVIMAGKTTEGAGLSEVHAPVTEALLAIAPAKAFDVTYKHGFTMPIVFAVNEHSLTTAVPPMVPMHSLRELFAKVKSGAGIPLAGKRAAGHAVVLFGDSSTKFFGTAGTMAEVDWIAFETKATPRPTTKLCGGYRAMGKTETKEEKYVLTLVDSIAELYDRETGKLLEKKTFEARDECPTMTAVVKHIVESYPPPAAVDDWLKQRLENP